VGIGILFTKDEYSYYLSLGDYVSNYVMVDDVKVESFTDMVGDYLINEDKVAEHKSDYVSNNMTSKKLLEMIEGNVYNNEGSGLVDEIKKSKYVTITLGINDVLNYIKYDSISDKLIYDEEILKEKINVFKHNYYNIVNEIKDINKESNVMLVGTYSIYGDNVVSNLLNDAIKDVSINYNCHFIDVSDIGDNYLYTSNKLYLNGMGQEVITNKVIAKINEM
jgi:lysophospholipase L1-like esterase